MTTRRRRADDIESVTDLGANGLRRPPPISCRRAIDANRESAFRAERSSERADVAPTTRRRCAADTDFVRNPVFSNAMQSPLRAESGSKKRRTLSKVRGKRSRGRPSERADLASTSARDIDSDTVFGRTLPEVDPKIFPHTADANRAGAFNADSRIPPPTRRRPAADAPPTRRRPADDLPPTPKCGLVEYHA